jgi:hypothetical protein
LVKLEELFNLNVKYNNANDDAYDAVKGNNLSNE